MSKNSCPKPAPIASLPIEQQSLPWQLPKYSKLHEQTLVVADWIEANKPHQYKLLYRLRSCASDLHFYQLADGSYRPAPSIFCKLHRLCPTCAYRRSKAFGRRTAQRLALALEKDSNLKAYFVTLTGGRTNNVRRLVRKLSAALTLLHTSARKDRAEGRESDNPALCALGVIWMIEIHWHKEPPGGLPCWDVHIHAIWLCSEPPNKRALSKWWHGKTGQFKVDAVPFKSYALFPPPVSLADALRKDAQKIIKYATKLDNCKEPIPPEALWEAHQSLTKSGKSPRLVNSYGPFRGPLPNEEASIDKTARGPVLAYRWQERGGYKVQPPH